MMRFRYLMIILCLFAELPAKVIQADTPAHLYTVRLGLGNEDLERQINALPWIKVTECDYPVKDASRIDFSARSAVRYDSFRAERSVSRKIRWQQAGRKHSIGNQANQVLISRRQLAILRDGRFQQHAGRLERFYKCRR